MRRVFYNSLWYKDQKYNTHINGVATNFPSNVACIYFDYIANRNFWEIGISSYYWDKPLTGITTVKVDLLNDSDAIAATSTLLMTSKDNDFRVLSVNSSSVFDDLAIDTYDLCGFNSLIRYKSKTTGIYLQKKQFFKIQLTFIIKNNTNGFGSNINTIVRTFCFQ